LALVVLPDDTELDDALWDLDDVEGFGVGGVGLEEGLEGSGELGECLEKGQVRSGRGGDGSYLLKLGFLW